MTPVSSLFLMCFERYLKDNLSSCPKQGKRQHTHKWKFSISTREAMHYCCCLCFIAIFGYMGNKFKVILQVVFLEYTLWVFVFQEDSHKNLMMLKHSTWTTSLIMWFSRIICICVLKTNDISNTHSITFDKH